MQNLVHFNEHLNSKDLFESFKVQLSKDFEQSNFESDFIKTLEPDFHGIREKIVSELHANEKRADASLMQLLYRIDISETQLTRYLQANANENKLTAIAELVIKRVLQKVITKRYYKIHGNS